MQRALLAAVLLATPSVEAAAPRAERGPGPSFLRGMTVSCPRWGEIWGSPDMALAVEELKSLGVEWISIHPYAGIRRDGAIRFTPAEQTGYLERAVAIAKKAGVELFWIPHIAYWGSFEWRGEIDFGDDEQAWDRFFTGYRAWILDQARFADRHGLKLLAVGVELEGTTHRKEWISILDEIRYVYRGEITYAANWDRLERVPFWDRVDQIGVQAYFPVSDRVAPTSDEIDRSWKRNFGRLTALSKQHGRKPVLFTEIGYPRSRDAARTPWAPALDQSREVLALRTKLMETAIEHIEREPIVRGLFWWKWIPGDDRWDRDFSMRDPEARTVLERAWRPRS